MRWPFAQSNRKLRRGKAIHAFCGPNGAGKTCAMVWDTLPSLDAGRPVLSTVRLLDFRRPRPCDDDACADPIGHEKGHQAAHPSYVPWKTFDQLMDWEFGDILGDEITGIASSREFSSLPYPIVNKVNQLRRADAVFRWTAPSWMMADVNLRRVTQAVTICTGFLPKRVEGQGERLWYNRRLFRWLTYDAQMLNELEEGKRDKLGKLAFDLHYGPRSLAFLAYDTYDAVSLVGHVSDHGTCMACGGNRRKPACKCPAPELGDVARDPLAGAPRVELQAARHDEAA